MGYEGKEKVKNSVSVSVSGQNPQLAIRNPQVGRASRLSNLQEVKNLTRYSSCDILKTIQQGEMKKIPKRML